MTYTKQLVTMHTSTTSNINRITKMTEDVIPVASNNYMLVHYNSSATALQNTKIYYISSILLCQSQICKCLSRLRERYMYGDLIVDALEYKMQLDESIPPRMLLQQLQCQIKRLWLLETV